VRAVVHDTYGPPEVPRLDEVERSTPKEDEVLVRVHATTVTRKDCGWRKPHPSSLVRSRASDARSTGLWGWSLRERSRRLALPFKSSRRETASSVSKS
jgi:hypothetical protein